MTEQIRQQNAEYQRSLEERISVLVEQQKQLAELNEQQAQELKSLRQHQQHLPSTTSAGEKSECSYKQLNSNRLCGTCVIMAQCL